VPSTLILAWLLTAGPTCGPIDLETAVALATARSDEIAIKRAEVVTAEADKAIARAARWIPSATATVLTGIVPEARGNVNDPNSWQGTSNRSFNGWGPFGRIDVNFIQPLYTWGRLDAAEAAAKAGIEARTLLLQDTTSAVQFRVVQLYWGTALARKLLGIAGEVEKALPDIEKRVKAALEQGSASVAPADQYKVELYKNMVRRRKAEAVKGRDLAQAAIAATLATAPERLELMDVPLPAPPTDVPDLPTALKDAVRRRSDLAALGQAINARSAEIEAARGAQLPQIFLGGLFAYSYAPNRDIQTNPWVGDFFNTLSFGASIGIRQDLAFPLLISQKRKVEAQREELERQKVGLARLVEVQVESAIAELRAVVERYEATRASMQTSRTWFRSATLDFEAGVNEAKDVLEAYAIWLETQVDNATAAYDLLVARAKLDQVTGAAPVRGQPSCELP
jgi:outer membrane protein TolC